MKTILFRHFFFLLLFTSAHAAELDQISIEANGLWEAHDFEGAKALYLPLQTRPLPPWQQTRLLYNLGAISLAQHQTGKALNLFQKIDPTHLSLPRFGRNLFFNEGIAYLQYAQTLALDATSPFFDQQALFTEQALRTFDIARFLDCHLQQMEQENHGFICSSEHLIELWTKAARLQLQDIHQKKAIKWMQEASKEALASYLSILIQELILKADDFQKEKDPSLSKDPLLVAYFHSQTTYLDDLWNALKTKKFSKIEKNAFDQASGNFQNALTKNHFSDISTELKRAFEKTESLGFKENIDLHLAHLNYEILLLQPTPAKVDIQGIQWVLNQLKGNQAQVESLESIQKNLKDALELIEKKRLVEARFYLLAGFGRIDTLNSNHGSSISILKHALDQAKRTFEMFLLSQVLSGDNENKKIFLNRLKSQQKNVLMQANLFIPEVLKEQTASFHESEDASNSCQQSPWDQAIPLFDHGYTAALTGEKAFDAMDSDPQNLATLLEQTIHDWQQALSLLLNPPQNQPNKGGGTAANTNPRNLAETFRLIQEMYLEDQVQPQQASKELHSW